MNLFYLYPHRSAVRSRLCPFTSLIPAHLKVGTRIVALYGQLEIYYAGVAAETPCANNGERVLVFFDDGFAQYLDPKNVYIVAKSCEFIPYLFCVACGHFLLVLVTLRHDFI